MASKPRHAVLKFLPRERLQPAVRREQQCVWRAGIELLLDPIVERRLLLAHQAEALTQLRDALFPCLIFGRLRLPEASAAVDEPPV